MSYSIIFDTKFIKLTDGRLLYLERSGCNNDTAGRDLSDYIGKIYTYDELQKHVISLVKNGNSNNWELKLRSKNITYYDYGKHLATMANRAKTYDEFISERYFTAKRYDGVNLLKNNEEKVLTPKEFHDCFYDLLYGKEPYSYRRILTSLSGEKEIINTLESGQHIEFYVGKPYKKSKIA